MVTGAYRCPVCGIDFPAGTPGAPKAAHSPAEVRPASRRERDAAEGEAEPLSPLARRLRDASARRDERPVDLQSVLDRALNDDAHEREARASASPAPGPVDAPPPPGADRDRKGPREDEIFSEPIDAAPFQEGVDFAEDDTLNERRPGDDRRIDNERRASSADAAARDGSIVPQPASDPPSGAGRDHAQSILQVRPAELRTPSGGDGAGEAPSGAAALAGPRATAVVVREPAANEIEDVDYEEEPVRGRRRRERRRRSKASALSGTLTLAIVLLIAVFGAALFLDPPLRSAPPGDGGDFARALGTPTLVSREDGWVTIPEGAQSLSLSAQGPFRVRVDSRVYSLPPGETLTVARDQGTSVAVRAVQSGANVRVRVVPAGRD